MSGEVLVRQGVPLTLRLSKGEWNTFFNGLPALKGRHSCCGHESRPFRAGKSMLHPFPRALPWAFEWLPLWGVCAPKQALSQHFSFVTVIIKCRTYAAGCTAAGFLVKANVA